MPNTVKIKVKLLVTPDGTWTASGTSECDDDDTSEMAYELLGEELQGVATGYWLTAEVVLPEPVEVPATVEPAAVEKVEVPAIEEKAE